MKKYPLFFLIGVFHLQISFGQNPLVKQWDYRYGGDSSDVFIRSVKAQDGGYLFGGSSFSGIFGDKTQPNWDTSKLTADFWIVKTNASGIKTWDKRYGGDRDDFLTCMDKTTDGGFILGGRSKSKVSGDKTEPNRDTSCGPLQQCSYDYWIVKVDSLGNKEWDKTFGTDSFDDLFAVRQTSDGGYILGGFNYIGINGDKTQASKGNYDYWIVKTDPFGNKEWDKCYGGTQPDHLFCVELTFDGGCILGGISMSDSSGDQSNHNCGGHDYWIIKIDSAGNKLWDKTYGGADYDHLYAITATADNGFILGGYSRSISGCEKTQSTQGDLDYWIVKIDSSGNKEWDRDFGGTALDALQSLKQTADKGYILSGVSYSGIGGNKTEPNLSIVQTWIIKTDSLGIFQWDKTLQTISVMGDGYCTVFQASDGGYIAANSSPAGAGGDKTVLNQDTTNSTYDFWISKYIYSTTIFSCSDTNFCGKQYIDFYDHSINSPTSWQWLFSGGIPSSSTLQNPVGIYYNSYGSFDVTLIACNSSGCDTLYLPGFINEYPLPPVPVVTWSADTLFSTPAFSYQWYFNSNAIPGATSQYYVFQQPGDYFVIVTDSNGCSTPSVILYTGIDDLGSNRDIYVIPNPTDGDFILVGAKVNSIIRIYDVTGRVMLTEKINSSSHKIHFEALDGIYSIEINSSNNLIRRKFIVSN